MTSEALVLPSFNRNFSQVVSLSPSGIIAYGCRNVIYFIDAHCYPPVVLDSKCIQRAYREKIAALSFCKCENTELIASISECGEVKIWDINTGACVNNFVVNEGVLNIEWIHGSPNTLVFPQDSKVLIKWNISSNNLSKIKLGSELKTCFITSNEKCPHLLAVGHNNGTITVLDIVQEKILQKFKDHTREINILTWSPVLPDTLLSVSSDFSVRSWRMDEEKSTKLFWLGRPKPEDRKRIRVLGICHPKEANVMICSNSFGEIGEVALSEEKPRFKPYSKMAPEVTCRCLFALFSSTLKREQDTVDILYCFDNYMFSIWNITEKKLVSFLPFFMGFIYDLSFSPVNPIYLSISNGDGILRVWNAQADSQISRMTSVFVQAKIKIMTAAWHPTLENIIAFGTDDGKLGIIDTIKKRPQYPFRTFHKGKVYSVCWGPYKASSIEDAGNDKYFFYSCGGGDIYINRHKKLNEQALNFHEVATQPADIQTNENTFSEITWKSDYSCVCIGTYKGFVDFYNDSLVFLTRCNLEMKSIESLKWHPESTYMSPTGSPLKVWLACSGIGTNIYIIDTSKIFEEKSENSANWVVKKLTGHKKHINALCWSPHMDGYLVSASKDGSALVWNACTGNIIASFLNHSDIVNTVQWSIFDEDIIYSGGQDNFLRVWRISQQKSVAPADKGPYRKKLKKPKLPLKGIEKLQDLGDEVVPENENAIVEDENTSFETSETNINKDTCTEIIETENAEQNVPAVHGKVKHTNRFNWEGKQDQVFWLYPNAKKSVSLFGNSRKSATREEDLKDCMKLADILCKRTAEIDEGFDPFKPSEGTLSDDEVLKIGLYTDQNTALRMADIQVDVSKSNNRTSRFCQLSVMTNKMQTLIKDAAVNGTLSSYLVSLAPSVSYSFWLEMCEKYAIQLMQEQQPYVACTYFLMCNKIYEAIDVLSEKGKIIDALALAKLRLPESDPVIVKLLVLIRKRYQDVSNSVEEAKCYLSLNDPLLAIKTLGSLPDASCVKVAAYICKKYNMHDEAEKYGFIFMQRCLMQCNWESFREFAYQEPSLQVYSILFAVHEAFYVHLQDLKKQSGIFLKEIFSLPKSDEVKLWNGTTCIDSDQSFMEYVCDVLASKNLLPSTENSLETIIKSLDTFSSKWDVSESSSDAHVAIAIYITKFILLTSVGDSAAATANFLKIFDSSCNIVFLPRIVFMLFFPMNLQWNQDMKSITCQSKGHNLENNTNKVVTQYQRIVQCVTEKIMIKSQPFDLTIVSEDSLQNDLHSVTEKIAAELSLKECGEFVLAYFVSYLVHDLSRLVDKKVLALECHIKNMNSDLENKADESVIPGKTVAEVPPGSNLIHGASENDKTEIPKEESELEVLIDIALKEAEEKIWTLTNSGATLAPENVSENSFQMDNIPDSCSNEMCSNDEKIRKKEVDLNIDNEESKNASNDKCYVEIYSAETVSNVGDCIAQVDSGDDDSHTQCLASIDLFYHMILFLMSNICKEEFTLLYYLKERLKCLHLARASHELSKFSKGSKANLNKSKLCSELKETVSLAKAKEPTNKTDLSTVIQTDQSVNEQQNTQTNQVKASKDDDNCNSVVESVNQIPNTDQNDDNELAAVISNEHNYSSPQEILENANKNEINSSQVADENLLKELPELIHLLELKAKGISYPSPLDIVPKVLQILYNVRQKSTCSFIQEKLHKLIDDIVHWVGTFQVANRNFVCAICH